MVDPHHQILALAAALRAKGHDVPSEIGEIEPFPADSFSELTNGVRSRRYVLRRFAIERIASVFSIYATPLQNMLASAWTLLGFGALPFAVGMAIFVSPWWLLSALLIFFFMKRAARLYDIVILRAALSAESSFCFLYYSKQIELQDIKTQTHYYNKN